MFQNILHLFLLLEKKTILVADRGLTPPPFTDMSASNIFSFFDAFLYGSRNTAMKREGKGLVIKKKTTFLGPSLKLNKEYTNYV